MRKFILLSTLIFSVLISGCSKSDNYSAEDDIERLTYSTIDGVKTKIYWLGKDESHKEESYMVLDIANNKIRLNSHKVIGNGNTGLTAGNGYSPFYIDGDTFHVEMRQLNNDKILEAIFKYKFINSKKVKFYTGNDYEHVFTCRPVAGSPDWSQYTN